MPSVFSKNELNIETMTYATADYQARSQAWVSGIGTTWYKLWELISYLSYHNHKDNVCIGKNELSSMSQRPRLGSIKISGDLSLAAKKKQQDKFQTYFARGGKKLASCYSGSFCFFFTRLQKFW